MGIVSEVDCKRFLYTETPCSEFEITGLPFCKAQIIHVVGTIWDDGDTVWDDDNTVWDIL